MKNEQEEPKEVIARVCWDYESEQWAIGDPNIDGERFYYLEDAVLAALDEAGYTITNKPEHQP